MTLKAKPDTARSLMSRISKMEAKIRRLESAQPAVWPFTIVDDEPEADGAAWTQPAGKMREICEFDWRKYAAMHGISEDDLSSSSILGVLEGVIDPDLDAVEMIRDVR